jgi:hypothetical protein
MKTKLLLPAAVAIASVVLYQAGSHHVAAWMTTPHGAEPVAKITVAGMDTTQDVVDVPAGEPLKLSLSGSVGAKRYRWRVKPERTPDGRPTFEWAHGSTDCQIFTRPGTYEAEGTVSNSAGGDTARRWFRVGGVAPQPPPGPQPGPTPVPVPPGPGPGPTPVPPGPTPPSPTLDPLAAELKTAFGGDSATALKYGAMWNQLAPMVEGDTGLFATTMTVYEQGLALGRKMGLNPNDAVAAIFKREMADFSSLMKLNNDLRSRIAAKCRQLGAACTAAGGG